MQNVDNSGYENIYYSFSNGDFTPNATTLNFNFLGNPCGIIEQDDSKELVTNFVTLLMPISIGIMASSEVCVAYKETYLKVVKLIDNINKVLMGDISLLDLKDCKWVYYNIADITILSVKDDVNKRVINFDTKFLHQVLELLTSVVNQSVSGSAFTSVTVPKALTKELSEEIDKVREEKSMILEYGTNAEIANTIISTTNDHIDRTYEILERFENKYSNLIDNILLDKINLKDVIKYLEAI